VYIGLLGGDQRVGANVGQAVVPGLSGDVVAEVERQHAGVASEFG
jgi:hypothetical protein